MSKSIHTATSLVLALVVAGCASTSEIANTAVKANLVQEQAHNQLLLLNVVRAYARLPMHFTQISTVRIPVGAGNPTFTLPIPLGADRTHLYTLGTSLAVSQSVDTLPMNTQEFMQGITTPVKPALMLHYLDQGWPQQLILHMFVRAVEFYDADDKLIRRIVNYPQNRDEFDRFQSLMNDLRNCEFDGKGVPDHRFYTSELTPQETKDLKAAAAAKEAGLVPVENKEQGATVRFASETKTLTFVMTDQPISAAFPADPSKKPEKCTGLVHGRTGPNPGAAVMSVEVGESRSKQPAKRGSVNDPTNEPIKAPPVAGVPEIKSARFILRSPEAMMYYLGEIARAQIQGQHGDDPRVAVAPPRDDFPVIGYRYPRMEKKEPNVTLFRIRKNVSGSVAVKVDYEGESFSLAPPSDADRSMHVLSLLTQIFALHYKGSETPVTTNVRVLQ